MPAATTFLVEDPFLPLTFHWEEQHRQKRFLPPQKQPPKADTKDANMKNKLRVIALKPGTVAFKKTLLAMFSR